MKHPEAALCGPARQAPRISFPGARSALLALTAIVAASPAAGCSSDPSSSTGGSTGTSTGATAGAGGTTGGTAGTGGATTGGTGGATTGGTGGTTTGGTGGTGTGGTGGAVEKPLYIVSIDHKASPSVLLKIDVQTGAGKVACTLPAELDVVNYPSTTFSREGILFASNNDFLRIDKIDPCTCAVTPVGPTGFGGIPGITANKSNGLFGIETTSDFLLDINPMTGAGTKIGDLGSDFTTAGATWSDALNNGQGGLYGINGLTNQLYTIDTATGAATVIQNITGVTFGGSVGVERHPDNGVIYGCTTDAVLYSIDPVTGVGTGIGTGMGHVSSCNNLAAPWTKIDCLEAL